MVYLSSATDLNDAPLFPVLGYPVPTSALSTATPCPPLPYPQLPRTHLCPVHSYPVSTSALFSATRCPPLPCLLLHCAHLCPLLATRYPPLPRLQLPGGHLCPYRSYPVHTCALSSAIHLCSILCYPPVLCPLLPTCALSSATRSLTSKPLGSMRDGRWPVTAADPTRQNTAKI